MRIVGPHVCLLAHERQEKIRWKCRVALPWNRPKLESNSSRLRVISDLDLLQMCEVMTLEQGPDSNGIDSRAFVVCRNPAWFNMGWMD